MAFPRSLFTVDLRSLVVVRLGLAVLLLVDLAMRWPQIGLFFTDEGVLPRDLRLALESRLDVPWLTPSIHALTGSLEGIRLLFGIHALAALALLVGFRTRIATVTCWILVVSLQSRAPVGLDGGDRLLSLVAFWGIFVPLGARFSLDARAGRGAPADVTSVTSIGSAGLLLQASFLYVFAAMEKWGTAWQYGGPALCHMFRLDLFLKPAGRMLAAGHPFLHHLSPLVTWGELIGGLAFFSPWWTDRVRLLTIGAFTLLQASFFFCIQVTIFPFVSVLATVPFLPASFWDALGIGKHEGKTRSISESHSLDKFLAGLAILVMTWMNLSPIAWLPFEMPRELKAPLTRLGLYQQWNMFSPSPPTHDGWPILEATLEDGKVLDLFTGQVPTERKPAVVTHLFRTFRESILFLNFVKMDWAKPVARNYLEYRVQEWNREHRTRIVAARLVMMYEPTLPDCREGPARPNLLAEL